MLVLTREVDQSVLLRLADGRVIRVMLTEIRDGRRVRLGIDAPADVRISRDDGDGVILHRFQPGDPVQVDTCGVWTPGAIVKRGVVRETWIVRIDGMAEPTSVHQSLIRKDYADAPTPQLKKGDRVLFEGWGRQDPQKGTVLGPYPHKARHWNVRFDSDGDVYPLHEGRLCLIGERGNE